MAVELCTASRDDRALFRELLDQYLRELAEHREFAVGASDASEYPYFELYWSECDRFPFGIWSGDKLVGFALIRRVHTAESEVMQVAEFFVRPEHRRNGIGSEAIEEVWRQHRGRWELQVMKGNTSAVNFWEKCISSHAQQWEVEEIQAEDGRRLFFHFEV
jgi:predicted acetyltransferase